jgi:hypothetical protein
MFHLGPLGLQVRVFGRVEPWVNVTAQEGPNGPFTQKRGLVGQLQVFTVLGYTVGTKRVLIVHVGALGVVQAIA